MYARSVSLISRFHLLTGRTCRRVEGRVDLHLPPSPCFLSSNEILKSVRTSFFPSSTLPLSSISPKPWKLKNETSRQSRDLTCLLCPPSLLPSLQPPPTHPAMPTPPLLSTPPPSLSSRLAAQWKWETSDSLLVNNGSCCRDYLVGRASIYFRSGDGRGAEPSWCWVVKGTERTALSYLRLTLILSLLSTALVAKVRLPSPESSLRGPVSSLFPFHVALETARCLCSFQEGFYAGLPGLERIKGGWPMEGGREKNEGREGMNASSSPSLLLLSSS